MIRMDEESIRVTEYAPVDVVYLQTKTVTQHPLQRCIMNLSEMAKHTQLTDINTSLLRSAPEEPMDMMDKMHSLHSKQQVDAFSSMVLVALPFPPVPVCCLKGDDNEDAVMSSHDLIARCMASSALMPFTAAEQQETIERKMQILDNLPQRVQQCHKQNIDPYVAFAECTRDYIAVYFPKNARKNVDVRILPATHVVSGDVHCTQARKHLQAHVQALHACGEIAESLMLHVCNVAPRASYGVLLEMYETVLLSDGSHATEHAAAHAVVVEEITEDHCTKACSVVSSALALPVVGAVGSLDDTK